MTLWLIMATRRKRRRWRTNILLSSLFLFLSMQKCESQFAPGPLPFNDAVQDAIEAARLAEGESLARARENARESIRRAQGVVGQAVDTVQNGAATAGQVSIAIESAAAAVGDAAAAVDGVARLRETAAWCPALNGIDNVSPPDPSLIGHVLHRCGFVGSIHTVRDEYYERYRQVENHACNVLFPLVIVRPLSTRDVAVGVKVAAEMGVPISVRSGGHGHSCNSIKNASLHFDLRRLDQVALQRSQYISVSCHGKNNNNIGVPKSRS